MRDPLTVLAEQAAAALGIEPERDPSTFTYEEWLRWSSRAELETVIVTLERFRDDGIEFASSEDLYVEAVPGELMRRAQLRRDLGLGVPVDDGRGRVDIQKRSCIVPFPKTVRGCCCAEDAVEEVAAEVQRVDASAVAAARARAEVLHGRVLRRLERARVWLRRSRPASSIANSGRRSTWPAVASVGVEESLPVLVEVVPDESPVVRAAPARRSWSAPRGRVTGADEFGREVARLAGVSYSTSTWRALPIVDGPRRDAW